MRLRYIYIVVVLFIVSCNSAHTTPPVTQSATTYVPQTATIYPTVAPTLTPTLLPTATATPTPVPDIGGIEFTGYWLKLSKEFDSRGFQKLYLLYQDKTTIEVIAWFCVRGSDNNTPNGFYFIAIDRPTTFLRPSGGEATTFFSHNFAWKLSYSNWYLHAAPWNIEGVYGCPTNSTGGCVNMRTDDFNFILNGGEYTNPDTGQISKIPNLSVGTPFVITENDRDCTYPGQCFNIFECRTGLDCFLRYTCQHCGETATSKWYSISDQNNALDSFPD